MRVVLEKMTSAGRMSIFMWNEKYLVKFEQGSLEQTYKFAQWDVLDENELAEKVENENFLTKVNKRFNEMMEDLLAIHSEL